MRAAALRLTGATALAGLLGLTACEQSADTVADADQSVAADAGADMDADIAADAADLACDRQCVLDALDAYVTALGAGDVADAPLADEVAFVENVTRMEPGEGLWADITTGPGAFQIRVPDEMLQSAGSIGLMQREHPPLGDDATDAQRADAEDGVQDVLVAIRLQLEDGLVTEAEHLVAPIANPDWLANLQTPRPGLLAEIPENRRLPHGQLMEIGASYYEALDNNDADLFPFAPDCERRENGILTAGGDRPQPEPGQIAVDCYGQIESGAFQYIDRIENRRMFAADPVTGLAMGLSHFRHPMDQESWTVTTIDGQEIERPMTNAPFDMPAAHIFKVGPEGQVHEIEAVGVSTGYDSPTGWE
jgi:hypothetical protein